MKARGRVTLKEIAGRAGVATGTVSMVLNRNPLVAASTRERVGRVIAELGYVYDRGAAQMRNRRTNIVGVSICNLINPYFAEITAGIERSLEALGRVLFLGNCGESIERQARFLATLREYNVEGVLLMPAVGTPKKTVAQFHEWRIPVVMVSRRVIGADADFAGNDNRLGSMLATRHLLRLGHERIAFVGLNRRTSTARDRAAGFRAALRHAGAEVAPELIVECDASREEGYRAIARLLERRVRPTAAVCFNDLVAFGVMLGLRHRGIEPGRDFSVIGFDDVDEAALWQPALTTMAVDVDAIGRAAGRLLHERIDHPQRPFEHVVLAPKLVVRSTCGLVPGRAGRNAARS